MNNLEDAYKWLNTEFPSPTGVTYYESYKTYQEWKYSGYQGFRPQQGLPIMNHLKQMLEDKIITQFPSPTGVTYYELLKLLLLVMVKKQ